MFISGAGLDPWVWDDVRKAFPFPTAVAQRPASGASASLLDYAESAISAAPAGNFTVVAHSIGGVVAAEVTRIVPDRVSGLLGLSAAIPNPGGSFVTAMPFPNRWILGLALRFGGTRPPESAIRRGLADGLDETLTDRIVTEFTPESKGVYTDKTRGPSWPERTGYIKTSRDREFPAALQQRFADRLGAAWHDELTAGHLPMLECPEETAEAVRRFIESP